MQRLVARAEGPQNNGFACDARFCSGSVLQFGTDSETQSARGRPKVAPGARLRDKSLHRSYSAREDDV